MAERGRQKITAAEVPLDVRAEIVAAAKRRQRLAEEGDADLRRQLLAEADALDAERAEAKRQADADRALQARGGLPRIVTPTAPELRRSSVRVNNEPLTYGPTSDFSFIRDLFLYRTAWTGALPTRRGDDLADVRRRLMEHQRQMRYFATQGTDEERAYVRATFTERARPWMGTISDHSSEAFRHFISGMWDTEERAVSTASTSMGDFVPPLFLLPQWQLWRSGAAPAASAAGQRPLPNTGMEVEVPAFTSKVNIAKQTTQNTAIASSTPETTYRTAAVITLAGAIPLSQQLFDRMGPGVTIDQVLAEQAGREIATQLDTAVVAGVLATVPSGNKLSNGGSAGTAALWADVGKGSMLLTTTEGTRLPATDLLMPPANVAWFMSQVDSEGRPIWTPTPGSLQARPGSVDTTQEGLTGFDVGGARVWQDPQLPETTSHATLVLGNFARGAIVYAGAAPLCDVWPEWGAADLTVLLTVRAYFAIVVAYKAGFVQISGSAYPLSPTFATS